MIPFTVFPIAFLLVLNFVKDRCCPDKATTGRRAAAAKAKTTKRLHAGSIPEAE